MCGRYYVSDETAKEIEKLVRQAEEKLKNKSAMSVKQIVETDIHPTDRAPVLLAEGGGISCAWLRWGFPMQQSQGIGLVFNARCESAVEKPLFREGILHRRVVVPAAGFYEWDKEKTKYLFKNETGKSLFMAGCCRYYEDGEHFVILTTDANSSMQPVHDRMPLLLEESEIMDWILDGSRTKEMLKKPPSLLKRSTEYEQMSFW